MKKITVVLMLVALLCGCSRVTAPIPETTPLSDAASAPHTTKAVTTQAPETEPGFLPSVGKIAKAALPADASAVYVSGKHVGSMWRKITLTTKEGETIEMAHFPIASLLTWAGEIVFTLPEEVNRALMAYTCFMNEAEVLAFYAAMETFLNAGGRGNSPGTTAATTAPPGSISDWMHTPLPGQPW